MKQTLLDILTEFYRHISELYIPIKELIQENVESAKISEYNTYRKKQDIKIEKLDKPYFGFRKPSVSASAMGGPGPASASAMGGPASARARAIARASAPSVSAMGGPASAIERQRLAAFARVSRITLAKARAASVRSLTPRSKKKSNLKIMGFNESLINDEPEIKHEILADLKDSSKDFSLG